MTFLVPLISGILFAVGVVISGMTTSETVLGFLDITGNWKPDLLFVMVGAISIHSLSYVFKKSMPQPFLDKEWNVPQNRLLDWPLIAGALVFGTGWGIAGVCPGPSLVAFAGAPSQSTALFLVSMIIGILLFKVIQRKFSLK
jgi:uncharacterized protein